MKIIKKSSRILYCFSIIKLSVIITIICANLSCVENMDNENLLGEWEGEMYGRKLNLFFGDDNKCEISYFNLEADSFEELHGVYKFDFSKTPISLSINKIHEINHPLFTIIRIKKNELLLAKFAPKWRLRPISFDNTSSLLKRVKL
jgi:hypothetical protein